MGFLQLASALGLAQAEPIGGLVRHSREAVLLDKALQQDRPISVTRLPVFGQLASQLPQYPGGQIATAHPRQ